MSKKIAICLALVSLMALGGEAVAEICTIDDVPAATLLLPYFEVDLSDPNGVNTLFSINNASAAPALAHVTVWTDLSVPVLDFDVYLTGFDVETISMRNIVNGILPRTQTEPGDPAPPNDFSPDGPPGPLGDPLDPPGVFLGTSGPCVGVYGPLPASFVNGHLIPSLTGDESNLPGFGCSGALYTDDPDTPVDESNIARGYVTVDSVNECSLEFPVTDPYFTDTANRNNVLWGDYFYVDTANDFAQGETLVHIEACASAAIDPDDPGTGPSVGNGAGHCPFLGQADPFTFYSRYLDTPGVDEREGLASQFAVRYVQGGLFDGGTDYIVWRDSRDANISGGGCPAQLSLPFTNIFPLNQELVVAFDEEENSEELCFIASDVSPPTGGQQTCFPLEAARYNVTDSNVPLSQSLGPTAPFGWMFLDLDLTAADESQAWVTAVMSALGRFSVGFDAIQLDSVCEDDFAVP